jgi:hypothetical protein
MLNLHLPLVELIYHVIIAHLPAVSTSNHNEVDANCTVLLTSAAVNVPLLTVNSASATKFVGTQTFLSLPAVA